MKNLDSLKNALAKHSKGSGLQRAVAATKATEQMAKLTKYGVTDDQLNRYVQAYSRGLGGDQAAARSAEKLEQEILETLNKSRQP